MSGEQRPVVVAFDGSDESRAALDAAAELFGDRPIVVVTVWESALAMYAPVTAPDFTGAPLTMPDPEQIRSLDRTEQDHAQLTAEAGVKILEAAGATNALPVPMPDDLTVAETVEGIAEQRGAAAIVVG